MLLLFHDHKRKKNKKTLISDHYNLKKPAAAAQSIGLATMFILDFRNMVWKNPNECFGQRNT